jgi:hypothetical protein
MALIAEFAVFGFVARRLSGVAICRSSARECRQGYATTLLRSVKRQVSSPSKIILAYRHRGRGSARSGGRTPCVRPHAAAMTAKCCQAFTAGRGLHFNCQVRHDHRRAMPGRSGVERICTARIAPYAFARAEMEADPRYLWGDDVPAAAVRRLLARSHAMVLSSLSEGGANVISEAAVAGVPVLARGRQCRAARRRLSRLLPRRRHASAGAPAAAARARAALRRPAGQGACPTRAAVPAGA